MNSRSHTPADIQSHLYLSFLHGDTADVQLHIKGCWEALYRLHRVVLIQAGFFRSLFTAGFLESNAGNNNPNAYSDPERVSIHFDDVSITRSAFEICVARLYGGGPELYLSPSLVPTTAYPLTPSFQSSRKSPVLPPNQHPATPHFLLSLLATSIYLCIPSITSQALSMILNSVGPYTIHRYLSFAIGHGIGPPEADEPASAIGLECVGKQVMDPVEHVSSAVQDASQPDETEDSDMTRKSSSLNFVENASEDKAVNSQFIEPSFNYGKIGDKIGQACACWLTRWGADMLPYEEAAAKSKLAFGLYHLPEVESSSPTMSRLPSADIVAPTLWARKGLTAPWVRAIISSDDFFIKGEWERYDFARRVVELRRRTGVDPVEEKEWGVLFQQGIHYTHMLFEDLMRISQDISPITGQMYVPIDVIHSAHWTQSVLRQTIVARPTVSAGLPPSSPRDKELGVTLSTAEILSVISSNHTIDSDKTKPYYPVPSLDTSQRIGDSDSASASVRVSAEQLLGEQEELSPGHTPTDQLHFFGILSRQHSAASCIQIDATGKARWSPYPPVRFAVEFWGVDALLEKSRLHSRTVWCAGSLFNVYVQVVRKKGVQLGVYLHRQSSVDPLPRASAPPVVTRNDRTSGITDDVPTPRAQSPIGNASVRSSSSTTTLPVVVPGSPSPAPPPSPSTIHTPHTHTAPAQPYRDPRAIVAAHFTISCASATGSSLTRFSSKPDQFAISQSWGWKSSSLRTEEYIDVNGELRPPANKETSLRATVVLGLI